MGDLVPRLPDWVQPGVSFRQDTGSTESRRTYHVRALVDNQAVMRRWVKGNWEYKCEGWEYFNVFSPFLRLVEKAEKNG